MNVFGDMIADMLSNKRLNPIVTELFIRGRKLNIYLVFITKSHFDVSKNTRLNSIHYFIIKIPNKKEFQQNTFNHLSDIDFQDFMYLYKKCTAKPYSFYVIDATIASDHLLRFKASLLERIQKIIVTIDDNFRDGKLQYDINREAAKIEALSTGKIDKYEYFIDEGILSSIQRQIIEQAKS